jgi:hypothetical protein
VRTGGITACVEYPNDNPEMHRGRSWYDDEEERGGAEALAAASTPEPGRVARRVRVRETRAEASATATAAAIATTTATATATATATPTTTTTATPTPTPTPTATPTATTTPTATPTPTLEPVLDPAPSPEPVMAEAPAPPVLLHDDEEEEDPADPLVEVEIEVVDELQFDQLVDEGVLAPEDDDAEEVHAAPSVEADAVPAFEEDAAPADPFVTLVRVLEQVLTSQGGGESAITGVRALLGRERLEGVSLDERACDALVEGGLATRNARGLARTEAFVGQVLGWQGILRGESGDFGPCGSRPLDEWAADVVARVLGAPARAEGIRRDLRRCGVAAFGLVAEAA